MSKLLTTIICVGLCVAVPAMALDFDFSGVFRADDDVQLLNFTVAADSTITIFSSSWDDGGFDPILAVWDSAGNLVNEQDDGLVIGSTLSNGTSYDHGNWDSYYSVFLGAGSYIASIAQYNNFANGTTLGAGFQHAGNPNFTFDLWGGPQSMFNGVLGGGGNDPRTPDWAFHILDVAGATQGVPDGGATLALLGCALLGLSSLRRKLRR